MLAGFSEKEAWLAFQLYTSADEKGQYWRVCRDCRSAGELPTALKGKAEVVSGAPSAGGLWARLLRVPADSPLAVLPVVPGPGAGTCGGVGPSVGKR